MIGTKLGPYEITAKLGQGGMGEVYRATDTKLGRDVAIKVLPAELAEDVQRLARFRREAKLLASLSHPNVAHVYGFESTTLESGAAVHFLAMELVAGEDLSERLKGGAIPVDEALEIAKQIAEALEEAHEHGIVHRDLKPGNVKVTREGQVKVLDFGLAKALDPGSGSAESSTVSTETQAAVTRAGAVLGTAAYMSPEQASGKGVDKRADIWAFGVVLFEMLTGKRLFTGETPSDVLAGVLKTEIDLGALPPEAPPAVRRLLRACLERNPKNRLHDVADARLEIQEVRSGTAVEPGVDVEGIRRWERRARRRWRWMWAALLAAVGLSSSLAYRQLTQAAPPRPAAHFVLDTPKDLSAPDWGAPIVSSDGKQVVFSASTSGGQTTLWIRPLDAPSARSLAGTEAAHLPFSSPDGGSVAFFTKEELRRLSLATETVQTICTLPQPGPAGGTWGRDGTLLFSAGGPSARIYAVPAAGGKARPLTTLDASRGERGHFWPQFLPDGRRFLFLVTARQDDTGLYMASLDRPQERRRIRPGLERALYAAPGHLLFVRGGSLLSQPFDAARAELTGAPVAVTSSVAIWRRNPAISWGWFSASANGTLAYLEAGAFRIELTWFDRKGARLGTIGKPDHYGQIALSPDGRRVAVELSERGAPDIWTIDLARGVATRQTLDPMAELAPVWSPDGRELVFLSNQGGSFRLYRKDLESNGPATPLGPGLDGARPTCWSAVEKAIIYVTASSAEGQAFGMLPSDGEAKPETILKKKLPIDQAKVSPDGRWLAYTSQESGQWDVYVEPFRREGERVRVSTEGGGQPHWRGDGREIFYVSPEGRLMAVGVRAKGDHIEVGLPVALFSGVIATPNGGYYAPTADGQRFLVSVPVNKNTGTRIHVVTNWTSLLR